MTLKRERLLEFTARLLTWIVILSAAPLNLVQPVVDNVVFDEGGNIYIMNADGSDRQQLTNTDKDFRPKISQDGQNIVFASERDGGHHIYVMAVDGSNLRQLTYGATFDSNASFSSDGSKIAFIAAQNGSGDIYVINVDGTNLTNITNSIAHKDGAIWSPVNDKIAFLSDREGLSQIYTVNSDGTSATRLTNLTTNLYGPLAWSPDGTKIAFALPSDGGIAMIDTSGENFAQITNSPDIRLFLWFSDTQIVFQNSISGWVMRDISAPDDTVVNLNWPINGDSFTTPKNWHRPSLPVNEPPVADAGTDQTIFTEDETSVQVKLHGIATDSDGTVVSWMWYENDKQKAGGVDPTLDLSPGIHVLTFVVMDDRGQTGQDSLTVFVINKAESVAPTQNETTADVFDAVAI